MPPSIKANACNLSFVILFSNTGIAKASNTKCIYPNIPAWILKLALGEQADIALTDQKVSASKILKTGFEFKYSTIEKALTHLLKTT